MTMFIIIMVIIIMCSKTAVLRPPVFSSRVSLDSRLSRFHNFDPIHQQYISKQVHLPSIWSSPRFFQNRIVTLMVEETRKRQVACRRRFENVTSWKGQKTIDWNAKWEGSQKLGVGSKSTWLFFGWILDSKNEFFTRAWQFYLDMARRWGGLLLLSVPTQPHNHTTTTPPVLLPKHPVQCCSTFWLWFCSNLPIFLAPEICHRKGRTLSQDTFAWYLTLASQAVCFIALCCYPNVKWEIGEFHHSTHFLAF